jgi:hypothetical protein
MFSLEEQISEWRRKMLAAGIGSPVPLEELENHLREDVEGQVLAGTNAQQAFENSVGQLGQPSTLKKEFTKTKETIQERTKKWLFALAGIPNRQLITNMNITNSNIESRWATYARAGAFIFPAAFLWLFTCVFVLPKVNEICQAAGATVFANAPAVFTASAKVGQAMIFLTHHGFFISIAAILGLVLLERYVQSWPRYRRLAVSLGVFLLNAAVLLSLVLMLVWVAVAASYWVHHGH